MESIVSHASGDKTKLLTTNALIVTGLKCG